MEYLSLLVPIVIWVLFFLYIKVEEERAIPQFLGIVLINFLLVLGISLLMRSGNFTDTEYLSTYVTKIRHLDKWNEYVHRTCTKEVPDGVDSEGRTKYRTVTYDCSYVEDHPERWILYDNSGSELYTDEEEFNSIKSMWNVSYVFVDMHRNYHTIDGDAQDYYFPDIDTKRICKDWTHTYENRILGSESVLRMREITEEEAKKTGLYNYPKVSDNVQYPILGKANNQEQEIIRQLNAKYGKQKQFRCFILLFPASKGIGISENQKAYWQGGNKNELVICIGLSSGRKIEWANCFSWQSNTIMDLKCRSWLLEQKTLNIYNLSRWIDSNIGLWKRREFKEFDYIESFLTGTQTLIIYIILLVINIAAVIVYNNKKERVYIHEPSYSDIYR